MERLQKVIASYGYASRRAAEELIIAGKVKVNGQIIEQLGYKVSSKDKIEIDDVVLEKPNKVYYLLNKPRGVISSTKDDKGRKTVVDLIDTKERIFPIGRLDYDTTGIILLTNDGNLANLLMHPKSQIDKVYLVKIKGILAPKDIMALKKGLIIDGYKTSKAKVKVKKVNKKDNTSLIELTIHEGKNHQVKKMFKCLGYDVLKLKRLSISFLHCNDLVSGEYRTLTLKEVHKLYNETKKPNNRF